MGPDAMAQLKRLAEQIQQQQGGAQGAAAGQEGIEEGAEADDEAVPELVEATQTDGAEEDKTEVSSSP